MAMGSSYRPRLRVAETDVFDAIASPVRRALLDDLRGGPVAVHELARGFTISRPAVSQHLRILRDCELIKEDRAGRERLYRLDPVPLQGVNQWVSRYERFWTERLVTLRDVLDSDL